MPRLVLAVLTISFLFGGTMPLAAAEQETAPGSQGFEQRIDEVFGHLVEAVATVLFYDVSRLFGRSDGILVIVVWLAIGAIFLTLRMGFVNLRAVGHAVQVVRGKYDNPADHGEVTHFQALSSALSATVGLGNIGGVAIAVGTGGPGAVFWIIVSGFFGMSMKFVECTLGQKYRQIDPSGRVSGGAMHYLRVGLGERRLGALGAVLSVLFAVLCITASFGGGNSFQVSQSLTVIREQFPLVRDHSWIYGVVMATAVAVVIIGGIRRIAATAEKIVPLMCGIYVAASLWILASHFNEVGGAFATIFRSAFSPDAMYGGFIGVLVIGIRRAVFSNEAGVGSAAIAHSAAKTDEPVREGIVALLEPFIDTIVVCTMTGLVIVITGTYDQSVPEYKVLIDANDGAALTSAAFGTVIGWFPYVLSVAVMLFAYSTMISWSYYGERCWVYLFGEGSSLIYKLMFICFCYLGAVVTATNILEFSDMMILAMSLPNLIGLYILSGAVKRDMNSYFGKLRRREFVTYK